MADFPNKSKYNALGIEVSYLGELSTNLKGVRSMINFFQKEIDFWSSSRNHEAEPIKTFKGHFHQCVTVLNAFEQQNRETNEGAFNSNWGGVTQIIGLTISDGRQLLSSTTPIGQFIFSVMEEYPAQGLGAYHFLTKQASNFSNVEQAIGNLKAYEFLMQDESQIKRRRDSEKKAISKVRNEVHQLGIDLQAEFDDNVLKYNEWREGFTEETEKWKTKLTSEVETWHTESDKRFNDFLVASNKKIDELEKLYTEKLRLEGPVKYWNARAGKLKTAGILWTVGLVLSIGATVAVVLWVLFLPPDYFSASIVNGDPLAIKGVILYGTVISFMAYLIKTFSKMTFSSFHLMRDAEEREQLTLGYLALLEKGAVTEKERALILEALFSRSETGLIKHESGPTMPGVTGLFDRVQGKR